MKGGKNRRTVELEEAARAAIERVRPRKGELTSLEVFRAIYRDGTLPHGLRMAAAEKALPYEHPRLQAIEHTGAGGGPIKTESVMKHERAAIDALFEEYRPPAVDQASDAGVVAKPH